MTTFTEGLEKITEEEARQKCFLTAVVAHHDIDVGQLHSKVANARDLLEAEGLEPKYIVHYCSYDNRCTCYSTAIFSDKPVGETK